MCKGILVVLVVWPKHWGAVLMTRRNVSPSVDFAPSASGEGGGWAAAVVLRALFFSPWLVLMEACRGCVSETAFWLAGVPLGCGSWLPLLAFKNRLVGAGGGLTADAQGLVAEDVRGHPQYTLTLFKGHGSHERSQSCCQRLTFLPPECRWMSSSRPLQSRSECQCLLCRSDAGHRAQSHVPGALVETHFIVNRTASSTVWAWPW